MINKSIGVAAITMSFAIMLLYNVHSYAWHENLGIDDNKASQLFQTNPNDPAIVQWKTALQLAINDIDKCFDIQTATLCVGLIPTIISNCVSHPNTLLACNDSRFPQYPIILKQAKEAQKEREESLRKSRAIQIHDYGIDMLDKCFINSSNASSNFEVASVACDLEMRSLQGECHLANNTYNYCKDERFVGYLIENNITNSSSGNG